MGIMSGSVRRVTTGRGLAHGVKTKPSLNHEQMRVGLKHVKSDETIAILTEIILSTLATTNVFSS